MNDYSPCLCSEELGILSNVTVVRCINVQADVIRHVFNRTTPSSIPIVFLQFSDFSPDGIPGNLLGDHWVTDAIWMVCSPKNVIPLMINPDAFRSSRNYTQDFFFFGCNLDQFNLSFFQGFQRIQGISIEFVRNFDSINWSTLPKLTTLETLGFGSSVGRKASAIFHP